MHLLGAHMSVAGGLEKAVQLAHAAECTTVQIFTKNSNQWSCKPLTTDQVQRWQEALEQYGIRGPVAHASYLINLASPDDGLWNKSIDGLVVEWQRAEELRLDGLVIHPGAHTTSSAEEGLQRVIDAVTTAIKLVKPRHCKLLLENTAGQGSCLGHTFEQLGTLIAGIKNRKHVGVCIDTCHAFAAGYELHTPAGYRAMKAAMEAAFPLDTIRALHLNDSKKECGSHVDRHEHIGQGCIGDEGFRLILNDPDLADVPGYLETPKGNDEATGEDLDHMNIRHLRSLLR